MKNIFWVSTLVLVCGFIIGCGKDDCDKKISAVQPNTNPAGYEVLIKTNGFTSAAKVVFGTVTATSRAGGEGGDIIAKVPAGVSGSNVEISVEEGDCIARSSGFVVSGALPSGVQPSLPNIIVPTTTTPPNNVGNQWINAATSFDINNVAQQTILIVEGTTIGSVINFDEVNSKEFIGSVTNPISGFANINTSQVQINIDRTASGGTIEHFDGQFIAVPNFLSAKAKYTILLVSRETGRQLLIYFPL
ncbi:MAG: hypothetical protein LH618_10760 [Saprospiraceae bacterium]|nr:hypothetical protein [Saprospiraceae bacterium]